MVTSLSLFFRICLTVVLLFAGATSGQTVFAPEGAVWYYSDMYNVENHDSLRQFLRYHRAGDTVVQGVLCNRVRGWRFYHSNWQSSSLTLDSAAVPDEFVYTSGDTVFYFNHSLGRFLALYIFNVAAGDTVVYEVPPLPFADTSFSIVIDSVQLISISNVPLRRVWFNSLSGYWGNTKYYTERIGAITGYLTGHQWEGVVGIFVLPQLRCYSDQEISVNYIPDCKWLPTDIPELQQNPVTSVYPNPTDGLLHINTGNLRGRVSISVTDLTGRIVHHAVWEALQTERTIRLPQLSPGVYHLQLSDSEHSQVYRQRLLLK